MSAVATHRKRMTDWEDHWSWSSYNYIKSCRRTQHLTILQSVECRMLQMHLKQIGKIEKLCKWLPHQLTTNQNNCGFEVSSSLIVCNNTNHFSDCDVWRKVDFMRQLVTISSVVELRNAPKHFPKPNLHQRKVMVTVWWSAASLIHYSFLNPGEPITSEKYAQQMDEMHQELQCLQPVLVNRKGSVLHDNTHPHVAQPALQKFNELDYEVLPYPPYSTWPLANQ